MTKIHFTIHPRRKGSVENKFDARLSSYWNRQYYDLFRGW